MTVVEYMQERREEALRGRLELYATLRSGAEAKRAAACVVRAALVALLVFASQLGCGATCERIEQDRTTFLSRKGNDTSTHLELLVPFEVANRLIEPGISDVRPLVIDMPDLGNLSSYFGELSVSPTRLNLRPAPADHLGFRLDFEVRRDGEKAFDMYMETELRPDIDLEAGKIAIGFTPEALSKTKPGISKNAKANLSEMIYSNIPSMARMLIPRSMVDKITDTAVDRLIERFYAEAKDKMLPRLADVSRFEISLPPMPLRSVGITSQDTGGGRLRLAVTTSLPVREGIAATSLGSTKTSADKIAVRISGSTAAELVNWAMSKGLLSDRYDGKGKPKKDGELRAGLDWVRGDERPMKVYLWDLEKPCMRITMSARPNVAVVEKRLEIKAEDAHTDDVEAAAFTKVAAWFHLLWKDAAGIGKKGSNRITMQVAGEEIQAIVSKAALEKDELVMEIGLTIM